jgi:hypothetical protein
MSNICINYVKGKVRWCSDKSSKPNFSKFNYTRKANIFVQFMYFWQTSQLNADPPEENEMFGERVNAANIYI